MKHERVRLVALLAPFAIALAATIALDSYGTRVVLIKIPSAFGLYTFWTHAFAVMVLFASLVVVLCVGELRHQIICYRRNHSRRPILEVASALVLITLATVTLFQRTRGTGTLAPSTNATELVAIIPPYGFSAQAFAQYIGASVVLLALLVFVLRRIMAMSYPISQRQARLAINHLLRLRSYEMLCLTAVALEISALWKVYSVGNDAFRSAPTYMAISTGLAGLLLLVVPDLLVIGYLDRRFGLRFGNSRKRMAAWSEHIAPILQSITPLIVPVIGAAYLHGT